MGKIASFVRNTFLGAIVLLLVYLNLKLYIIAERFLMMYNKINEMNGLMKNLYEIMKAIGNKFRIQIPWIKYLWQLLMWFCC